MYVHILDGELNVDHIRVCGWGNSAFKKQNVGISLLHIHLVNKRLLAVDVSEVAFGYCYVMFSVFHYNTGLCRVDPRYLCGSDSRPGHIS